MNGAAFTLNVRFTPLDGFDDDSAMVLLAFSLIRLCVAKYSSVASRRECPVLSGRLTLEMLAKANYDVQHQLSVLLAWVNFDDGGERLPWCSDCALLASWVGNLCPGGGHNPPNCLDT